MAGFGDDALFKRFKIELKHLPSGRSVAFKAFLTQFEDQFSSDWNTEQLFGRMDPIRSFRGTQRQISLGFDVLAAGVDEARDNLAMCSKFLSMLYPSYSSKQTAAAAGTPAQTEVAKEKVKAAASAVPQNAATIQGAPLFRLKFANLIQSAKTNNGASSSIDDGLIGSIDGLTYSPDIEQGFFDPKEGNNNSILYPQTIKLAFGFFVAHEHALGWSSDGEFRTKPSFPYPKGKE
jgi:hypothetical protein